jgi:hypothetical protein
VGVRGTEETDAIDLPRAEAEILTVHLQCTFPSHRRSATMEAEVSRMSELQREIERRATERHLPCAAAFAIAEELGPPLTEVVDGINSAGVRIVHCQLGLFGYQAFGDKRFAAPLARVPDRLAEALRAGCVHEALPCATAWAIAEREGLPRPVVGSAADALGLRIAPCQLGCF